MTRVVLGFGMLLTAIAALGVWVNTTALPAVVDPRPALLVVSALGFLLLVAAMRARWSRAARVAVWMSLVFTGAVVLATAYDLTLAYRTEDVSFNNGGVELRGTLYRPRSGGPHPAAILIHGAGRQPRDEYRFYARNLAKHGIAALAYDKRGSGKSGGNGRTATYQELAADAVTGIELLRQRPDIDRTRVGIWALSEGEWVGPLAATQTDPAFLVLISASAMTPSEQVKYETGANVRRAGFPEEAARQASEAYAQLSAFQRTGENRDELNRLLEQARQQPWFEAARYLDPSVPEYDRVLQIEWFPAWRARMDFDALPLLERLKCPVLAQVGGSDPKNDGAGSLERIRQALARGGNTRFTGRLYPDAEHNIIEWRLPGRVPPPFFARDYLADQVDWVRAQVRP